MYSILYTTLAQSVDLSPLPQPGADNAHIQTVFTILFGIFAAIALLVIVISGLRYVLSAGDPSVAARTKSTIVFASAGLIVSMLAFAAVSFVLGNL